MQKNMYILGVLISTLLSMPAVAQVSTDGSTHAVHRLIVTRGQLMPVKALSHIADLSTTRDQQGKPVSLDKTIPYTVASFTRTTISIVPPGGGEDDVITLNLNRKSSLHLEP